VVPNRTLVKRESPEESDDDPEESGHARDLNRPTCWLKVLEAVAEFCEQFVKCFRLLCRGLE